MPPSAAQPLQGAAAGIVAGTPLTVLPGGKPEVVVDEKGKLHLPSAPAPDDNAGQCAWLTASLALDHTHPITSGRHEGLRGAAGHVVLERLDAPPLRFEPASRINTPMRLIEDLTWQAIPTDSAPHALKGDHCRAIAHVIRQLCGATNTLSDEQETAGIVGSYLHIAEREEGYTTYGTPQQRYEAARALRRDRDGLAGPPRYLLDENTGELVIAVSDLAEVARRHIGSSLARGWLDARMQNLGWQRIRLDGHAEAGRAGRTSHHATVNAYRGHLPAHPDETGPVTK